MEIEKIQLEYAYKNGFTSPFMDKIRHIKTLPFLSVVQAIEGNYDIKIGNGKQYNTGNKGFFIAPSNFQQTITHNSDIFSKKTTCRWVFLKIKINDLYDFDTLYDFPIIIPENFKDELNTLFNNLFSTSDIFDEYTYYFQIIRLLHLIATKKEHKPSLLIEEALKYIKNHYDESISVQTIAGKINISKSHLFSVFKKNTGVSPIAYLNNYRLSVAADELINTDKPITEIANMVGITDSIYFNKMFRKSYQMSPSKYREIYKNDRE